MRSLVCIGTIATVLSGGCARSTVRDATADAGLDAAPRDAAIDAGRDAAARDAGLDARGDGMDAAPLDAPLEAALADSAIADAPEALDAPSVDAPSVDAPEALDAPSVDAPEPLDAPSVDAPSVDACDRASDAAAGGVPLDCGVCTWSFRHYDCFGGLFCVDGDVYLSAYEPRHLCWESSCVPWSDPVCATGPPIHRCAGCRCASPDPRYASCVRSPRYFGGTALDRLFCEDGTARSAGDPCTSDDECRPAAEGVAALRCEAGRCAPADRPDAPAGYGEHCGLASPPSWLPATGEHAVAGVSCALCHVARDASGTCVRQACTIACTFDEDCPAGSVCLCSSSSLGVGQFCAAVADRASEAGRTAWLGGCAPDAGR